MFQRALQIAKDFTLPLIISHRQVSGKLSSQVASFIILNDAGWILTAHHVIELIHGFAAQVTAADEYNEQRAEIAASSSLTKAQRKQRMRALSRPPRNHTTDFSVWWGHAEWTANSFECDPTADLAVGQLTSFDGNLIGNYPTFKNPNKSFSPGISLCKLGFPFHRITPDFDQASRRFTLPKGALPVPLFAIDGMFARTALVDAPRDDRPWSIKFVETSSPGLMGQSGGPTFDAEGRVWAMQSRTAHYPMGFSPDAPGKKNLKEHQFLNVGYGIHAETILAFLDSLGIEYDVSDD